MAATLTRAEQDDIIMVVTAFYRISHYHLFGYWPAPDEADASFRAALRLDDKVLDDIIRAARESGVPLAWSSERVPA